MRPARQVIRFSVLSSPSFQILLNSAAATSPVQGGETEAADGNQSAIQQPDTRHSTVNLATQP
jgi:hypothetical protein